MSSYDKIWTAVRARLNFFGGGQDPPGYAHVPLKLLCKNCHLPAPKTTNWTKIQQQQALKIFLQIANTNFSTMTIFKKKLSHHKSFENISKILKLQASCIYFYRESELRNNYFVCKELPFVFITLPTKLKMHFTNRHDDIHFSIYSCQGHIYILSC